MTDNGDLAARLRRIEDRQAIEDVLLAYYAAVDTLADLDGLTACFTPDALFDVTALGLPSVQGRAAIARFFAGAFAETAHHAHHVANFRIFRLDDEAAQAHCSVFAHAIGRTGVELTVHCTVDLDLVRTADGWRIDRFVEASGLPLPGAMAQLHAHQH